MWTGSQLHYAWRGIHCTSPVVTVVSCEAQRALMMPIHCLSAHSTCRKLHVWFNTTQPRVFQSLLLVVCCSSSAVYCVMIVRTAWLIANPCHILFSEYIPVNAQCRLYNFPTARYDVTQAANTFRISCLDLKGVTSLDLVVLNLKTTFIT
jgi:hypothetical protein